jgi:hypothetical protein
MLSPSSHTIEVREAALSEAGLGNASRCLWVLCIAVYLTVFIGGLQAGGAELVSMGRATAFTLVAAVLGRVLLGFLSRASLPVRPGQSADQDGPVGSLVDLVSSTNVAKQEDEAEAA